MGFLFGNEMVVGGFTPKERSYIGKHKYFMSGTKFRALLRPSFFSDRRLWDESYRSFLRTGTALSEEDLFFALEHAESVIANTDELTAEFQDAFLSSETGQSIAAAVELASKSCLKVVVIDDPVRPANPPLTGVDFM